MYRNVQEYQFDNELVTGVHCEAQGQWAKF